MTDDDTTTEATPLPRWKIAANRVMAKMRAIREEKEAEKRAKEDALRAMRGDSFTADEPQEDCDFDEEPSLAPRPVQPRKVREKRKPETEPKPKKKPEPEAPAETSEQPRPRKDPRPVKAQQREKRKKKRAILKKKREDAAKPKPLEGVISEEQAALLRGGDEGMSVSYQCAAETLATKHPENSKYHLEKTDSAGGVEFTRKSVNKAVYTLIDNALLRPTTAWRAEFLQAPIITEAPSGWVELREAARRAGVSLKTIKKRRDKNRWHTRYFRMRQEDGTVKIALFIPEFNLARYIDARNKQVYGRSDWEYSLSRRAEARNNRRRCRA